MKTYVASITLKKPLLTSGFLLSEAFQKLTSNFHQ